MLLFRLKLFSSLPPLSVMSLASRDGDTSNECAQTLLLCVCIKICCRIVSILPYLRATRQPTCARRLSSMRPSNDDDDDKKSENHDNELFPSWWKTWKASEPIEEHTENKIFILDFVCWYQAVSFLWFLLLFFSSFFSYVFFCCCMQSCSDNLV